MCYYLNVHFQGQRVNLSYVLISKPFPTTLRGFTSHNNEIKHCRIKVIRSYHFCCEASTSHSVTSSFDILHNSSAATHPALQQNTTTDNLGSTKYTINRGLKNPGPLNFVRCHLILSGSSGSSF